MKKFVCENKTLVTLWILCGIALFIFCGHYGNILSDIGREIYYPERILSGDVLYKDIFDIYGPFAYLYNALLYKIFSPNLAVLYFSGILCSFAIVSGVYLIAKRFLSNFLSFTLGLLTIVTGICATHLFNFTLPYSYSMLYGTVGFVYAVLALIKYNEEKKAPYLYLTSMLAGFCVANKYDFFIFALLVLLIVLFTKNKRTILSCITCFLFVPVICALVLFLQGLRLGDVTGAINYIRDIISTDTLNTFYTVQGIYYNPKILLFWGEMLLKTLVGFGGLFLGWKLTEKNKIVGYTICTIFTGLILFFTKPIIFMYLTPLLILATIAGCKKLKDKTATIFLVLCSLSVCAKSFWALHPLNYGNYFYTLIITAFLAVLFTFMNKKYEKIVAIGLIAIAVNFLYNSTSSRLNLNNKITTSKGTIYTYVDNADATQKTINYLKDNNARSALIYPEGLIINFLANVEADSYYNSLLPLYAESLGENTFSKRIQEKNIEYIIFNNLSMKEYGYNHICDDYAENFCEYVKENYTQTKDINEGLRYIIFQKKN